MDSTENYHSWLRDAHAMEKQAETMLREMSGRLEHYPDLKARLEQHITETQDQQVKLEKVLDRLSISHSSIKDVMGKMSAMGQAMGGVFADDEVVKGAISGYVFEHFEIACYTSLIAAAQQAGDLEGARVFEQIREQEIAMADWALTHLPGVTEQFLLRSEQPGAEAKK